MIHPMISWIYDQRKGIGLESVTFRLSRDISQIDSQTGHVLAAPALEIDAVNLRGTFYQTVPHTLLVHDFVLPHPQGGIHLDQLGIYSFYRNGEAALYGIIGAQQRDKTSEDLASWRVGIVHPNRASGYLEVPFLLDDRSLANRVVSLGLDDVFYPYKKIVPEGELESFTDDRGFIFEIDGTGRFVDNS